MNICLEDRIKELPVVLDDQRPAQGTYWNPKQYRVELWFSSQRHYWISVELLSEFAKAEEDDLKRVILMSSRGMRDLLSDIFFPEGKRP